MPKLTAIKTFPIFYLERESNPYALRQRILLATFSYLNQPLRLAVVVWAMPLPYTFQYLGSVL